jgi:hypothetical protein
MCVPDSRDKGLGREHFARKSQIRRTCIVPGRRCASASVLDPDDPITSIVRIASSVVYCVLSNEGSKDNGVNIRDDDLRLDKD